MRVAFLSLLAAGSLTTAALAQEAGPVAPEAPVAPAAPVAEPAPPAPEAPPAPPPAPPAAPTEATSVAFRTQLEQLCMPLVRGGDLTQLATRLGYKKKRDGSWELPYQKGYKIVVRDPGTNPKVCSVLVQHPVGGLTPTIEDTHAWAVYRDWTLEDNAKRTSDMERTTRKWEFNTPTSREVIVLLTTRKLGDLPINPKFDQTELVYTFITY
jgi:hypothetical protein